MDGEPSSLADEAPLARAARLAHAGDLAAALELREVLALRPGHAEAHGRLGLVLYQQGFEAEAIWHLKSAVRRSGQSRRWERALKEVVDSGLDRAERKRLEDAFNALAQGRAAEALAEFQDLSARRPRAAAAWVGLRSALHALGRFEEAAEAADRWRGVSPSHRAGVEAALARPLSRRGLVFDPREPLPVRPMAEVLTRVGSPEELARTPNAYLQIDAEPLPIHCTPVISLEPDGSDAMDIHAWTTPRVMARIDDALLAGRGLVVTRSGEVISELLSHRSWGAQLRDGMLHFPAGAHGDGAGRVQVFDSPALVMAGPTDRVYGDWINQYPTRLSIAEAAGVDSPPVIRWDLPERYVQMLEEVGVDADFLQHLDVALGEVPSDHGRAVYAGRLGDAQAGRVLVDPVAVDPVGRPRHHEGRRVEHLHPPRAVAVGARRKVQHPVPELRAPAPVAQQLGDHLAGAGDHQAPAGQQGVVDPRHHPGSRPGVDVHGVRAVRLQRDHRRAMDRQRLGIDLKIGVGRPCQLLGRSDPRQDLGHGANRQGLARIEHQPPPAQRPGEGGLDARAMGR